MMAAKTRGATRPRTEANEISVAIRALFITLSSHSRPSCTALEDGGQNTRGNETKG